MNPVKSATVTMWGITIGYVTWDEKTSVGSFQYDEVFAKENTFGPAPIHMPVNNKVYRFEPYKSENDKGYMGLPGLLADSLPDAYGHAVIDEWLVKNGRMPNSFNPVERLCYIGTRGMGALEFSPVVSSGSASKDIELDVKDLIDFANSILQKREDLKGKTGTTEKLTETLTQILEIGSTAGGARAKCVVAWNRKRNKLISGQLNPPKGYTHWLLKLDGVDKNGDKGMKDPKGYLNIEYAYYKMALECEIQMAETQQLIENNRYHFITRRFDRPENGPKYHMSTVHGLAHFDFNKQFIYSYESITKIIEQIVRKDLVYDSLEQFFRRAVFNIFGVNQDDHTKNCSFIMTPDGNWYLAPAYDVSWNENLEGWTKKHQLQLNGKTKDHTIEDLWEFAKVCNVSKALFKKIIDQTNETFQKWKEFAVKAGLDKTQPSFIKVVEDSLQRRRDTLFERVNS